MMFEMLLLLIVVSILIFLFIILLDENWKLCFPLIMVNMIFIVLITYGFWSVDWFYLDSTLTPAIYSTDEYGVYSYIFVAFFFIHILLFIKAGHDALQESLKTKGQINYNRR